MPIEQELVRRQRAGSRIFSLLEAARIAEVANACGDTVIADAELALVQQLCGEARVLLGGDGDGS